MPRNIANVTNDPVLDQVIKGYMPKDQEFVFDKFLPVINVTSDSGEIPEADAEFLRIHNNVTVARGETPEIDVSFSKSNAWKTEEHRLKILVTKKDGQQWDRTNWKKGQIKAKNIYGKMLRKSMLIAREKALADVLQSTAVLTNNVTLSGSDQLDDYTNSDPVGVFKDARSSIFNLTGFEANVAVMNRKVFEDLIAHPKIKATVGVSTGGTIPKEDLTKEQLAKVMKVEDIIVGKVMYNSAKKGQTKSLASVWGNHIIFAYRNPNPTPEIFEDSIGYRFELTQIMADSYEPDDPPNAVFVREQEEYDDVLLDVNAAYLIYNAVSA